MAWCCGFWRRFSAIPRLWRGPHTRTSQSLRGALHPQNFFIDSQMNYRTQPYQKADIVQMSENLAAALRNENTRKTVEILEQTRRKQITNDLFKANRHLQKLTERNLQKTLPTDLVYGDKDLFSTLIRFLGNKHSGPAWSAHFLRGCLDQERLPHLAASTHLGFVVNLLNVCNQAQLKLTSKTASDIDSWLNSFLEKRMNPKLDKRFTQFLSCAGNAELRFSGSTTEKLIVHMMQSMRSNNAAATPNHYTTSLATYVWYFKMVKTIPSLHAEEFWSLWQDCAVKFVAHFTEQGCSMILNSIADLELKPTSELLKSILEKVASLEFRKSQTVSNCLRSMTFISRAFPEAHYLMTNAGVSKKLMTKWLEMLREQQLEQQHLSNGIWGITELGLVDAESVPQVLDVFYENSLNLIPRCTAQGLSNILLSIGKLHQLHQGTNFGFKYCDGLPKAWWKSYWGQFSKVLNGPAESFIDQQLSNIIAGISFIDLSPLEYRSIPLNFLLGEVERRIEQMNDINISTVILHLGHLKIKDEEVLAKAFFRIEELCSQKKMDGRSAINLATGMALLAHRIPAKLWECIGSNIGNMLLFHVLKVLDVCTIQHCVFEQEQEPPLETLRKVVEHSMALNEAATGRADLSILQRAVICFGEAFSKDQIRFITEKQPMFQRLAQEKVTGYFTKGEKTESERDMAAILAKYHDHLDVKSTWQKVVPEAGCTVNFEVQDRRTNKKFAIQPDGFNNSYYDSEGNRTSELTASTKTNSKLLENAGYRVFRCDGLELKRNPDLVDKKLREFFEKHGVF